MLDHHVLDDDDDDDDDEDLDDGVHFALPEPPRTHDGMPIHGWDRGEPIPDLDRIPRERWREVLAPLRRSTRESARSRVQSDVVAASVVIGELWLADGDARHRAVEAPPPGMPAGSPPLRGAGRQVSFRLGAEEYERLVTAADLFAMRASTLARVLTVRGVDRALYEASRDR